MLPGMHAYMSGSSFAVSVHDCTLNLLLYPLLHEWFGSKGWGFLERRILHDCMSNLLLFYATAWDVTDKTHGNVVSQLHGAWCLTVWVMASVSLPLA